MKASVEMFWSENFKYFVPLSTYRGKFSIFKETDKSLFLFYKVFEN